MSGGVPGDLVYFFHIPKTSGTSLHHSLLRMCGEDVASSPHLLWDDLVNGRFEPTGETRVIAGHFGGFLPLWLKRWPRMVTILRDPMARALSHINHVRREPVHPLHAIAAGLGVEAYCEHPVLRKTVDNFQSRYLASLDFALALLPRPGISPAGEPQGSFSVRFEESLHALDQVTGLQEAAIRALDAIDAVGLCEAHATSLQLFAKALGWEAEVVEYALNHASGQRTLDDLSDAERAALSRLNEIDERVYAHAAGRFLREGRAYGLEPTEKERMALARRGLLHEGDPAG